LFVFPSDSLICSAQWWLKQQLKQCRYKKATTGVDGSELPPYNHEETTLLSEKSPFF
jgi:hypothetical protein